MQTFDKIAPPPAPYAAAYIRESSGDTLNDKEKAGQIIDCESIAKRNKIDPATLVLFDDWSRSGNETAKRPAQDNLMKEISKDCPACAALKRDGKTSLAHTTARVTFVFARSIDRMMRSTLKMAQFYRLCEDHATRIITLREGEMRDDNPSQWISRQAIMMAAEYESRVGRVRAAAGLKTKRRQDQIIGRKPYGAEEGESVQHVLDVLDSMRTYNATAARLNAEGFPTRMPTSKGWNASQVARVERASGRPASRVLKNKRGAAVRRAHLFSGLLKCHCGAVLTSMPAKSEAKAGGPPRTAYLCNTARQTPAHSRPYQIAETEVRAFIDREITKLLNSDRYSLAAETSADAIVEQARIATERKRIGALALAGVIDLDQAQSAQSDLDAQTKTLDTAAEYAALPIPLVKHDITSTSITIGDKVDWSAPTVTLNQSLRLAIDFVPLGADFKPLTPVYRFPEWNVESAS